MFNFKKENEMKKKYIHPIITVVCLQHSIAVLHIHSVNTSGDVDMDYKDEGGDPQNAW